MTEKSTTVFRSVAEYRAAYYPAEEEANHDGDAVADDTGSDMATEAFAVIRDQMGPARRRGGKVLAEAKAKYAAKPAGPVV